MKTENRTTVDVFDPNAGWIECWKCQYCGKLIPVTIDTLNFTKCPYCSNESHRDQLRCERPEFFVNKSNTDGVRV